MEDRGPRTAETVATVVGRAIAAYRALGELAETIDDEWQYVQDVTSAYLAALEEVAAGGGAMPLGAAGAVDEAIEEIALIADPNRAIDWLSTFPHLVALAVGAELAVSTEPSSALDAAGAAADADAGGDIVEDSPFRALLRRDER